MSEPVQNAHLPVLARPDTRPDLRPLFATLFERWRESKMADPARKGRRPPSYEELAVEIRTDTGRRVDRQTLYRASNFRVDDAEVEHRECRQPQWWLILWMCNRLGWSVLIRPDGIRLVREERSG